MFRGVQWWGRPLTMSLTSRISLRSVWQRLASLSRYSFYPVRHKLATACAQGQTKGPQADKVCLLSRPSNHRYHLRFYKLWRCVHLSQWRQNPVIWQWDLDLRIGEDLSSHLTLSPLGRLLGGKVPLPCYQSFLRRRMHAQTYCSEASDQTPCAMKVQEGTWLPHVRAVVLTHPAPI